MRRQQVCKGNTVSNEPRVADGYSRFPIVQGPSSVGPASLCPFTLILWTTVEETQLRRQLYRMNPVWLANFVETTQVVENTEDNPCLNSRDARHGSF